MAFAELADNLLGAVDKRNRELPGTKVVEIQKH
jgi:hypothetical protein